MRLIDADALSESIKSGSGTALQKFFADVCVATAPTIDAVILPPVNIGDTAFFIINGNIFEGKVYFIRWERHKGYGIHSDISASFSPYTTIGASFDDFGKTVFLTREEAEAALAERMTKNE